jgi:hypothetical protein
MQRGDYSMPKRNDISDADITAAWNEGLSLNAIARRFDCSVDMVAKRLKKSDITGFNSHSVGASRYFDMQVDGQWDNIKLDLDNGMTLSAIQNKYHITKRRLLNLFSRRDFDYDSFILNKKSGADELYCSQLKSLRESGKSVKEIAGLLNKSATTVGRDMSRFGLTKRADRTDIQDADILSDWNAGLTINEIAGKYNCSHDTITKRLKKHNISCSRPKGIERHFDLVHDDDWNLIKSDLDKCMPVSVVATRHNMRYEAVYRMIERYGYQYDGLQRLDDKLLKDRIMSCTDDKEMLYLSSILNYAAKYHNLPVVYTLSRFMDIDTDTVRTNITKYSLYDFIGNSGPSVKVLRLIHDLDQLGIRYELNNRTVLHKDDGSFMEIDIYLPDYKLGLEVNPTWTHSVDTGQYGQPDRYYHQNKSLLAAKCGVGLLHLYDIDFTDEALYQVLLTQIKALAVPKIKLGARECHINMINRAECNKFLEKYHFQGGENSSLIQYGMFHNGDLIGVLSIGRSRYTSDTYEVVRYCMNPSYIVIGCFAKLFKCFLSSLSQDCTIVSYMNLNKRFRPTDVYEKNGFTFDGVTEPDYAWYNQSGTDMKSRYSVTKKQLVSMGFDASKSEIEIMREQGYYRVFGAGSKRYVYHYDI